MVLENLPNAQVIDNQYANMVDQKVNYLMGKPFTFSCENKEYVKILNKKFTLNFRRVLKYVCEDALNGGKGWLFVYYDEQGELAFRRFPAYQILPFWKDDDHTTLDAAARLYLQEVWDGLAKKIVKRVELFKPDGIYRYILDGSTLVPDVELGDYSPYITAKTGDKVETYNWNHFPLIAWKYNKKEIPLMVDEKVNVLTDINSFISITDEKSGDFSSNQTIRVLDQIANDIAVLFGKKYIGKVPNDESGRISLWNDIVKHHQQLQDIRAIENFSPEDVTVEKGDTKKAVVVTDYVSPINAMEQLYMTVWVQ